jgi:predicted alpha/beta hydrolase family esterase
MKTLVAALLLLSLSALADEPPVTRTITVPFDYSRPELGTFPLEVEFGAPFDPAKPIVLVIADGQQFYVSKGSVAGIRTRTFGDAFNVAGILPRGANEAVTKAVTNADGTRDWQRAWQFLQAEQWLGDIESVRKALAGEEGLVSLFGASGGADLIHHYLVRYGRHIARAYTASPGSGAIEQELGLRGDLSWSDPAMTDPATLAKLQRVLKARPAERPRIMITLQRQHFFVSAADLRRERKRLVDALAAGDEKAYEKARADYQVDAILDLEHSAQGLAIAVREFEFLEASGNLSLLAGDGTRGGIHPGVESTRDVAAPLLDLLARGAITVPPIDRTPSHTLPAEVFLLASRWDEAIDYRVAIALAYSYPKHLLFIADDNHVFGKARTQSLQPRLVQTFLLHGIGSPQLDALLKELESYRWHDQ